MSSMNRETLKRRLKALRELTVGRGCTEAEAMAAAAKLAELMREHGVSEQDLDMGEAVAHTRSPLKPMRAKLWSTIAHCTNTAALISEREKGRAVTFYGREPGPEIATYLFDVCENAIRNETANFRPGEFYKRRRTAKTKRIAVEDFTSGLIVRLNGRLLQLFATTRNAAALETANAHRDRLAPGSRTLSLKPQKGSRFESAVQAGWDAGGRVHLSHGMETKTAPRMIGVQS